MRLVMFAACAVGLFFSACASLNDCHSDECRAAEAQMAREHQEQQAAADRWRACQGVEANPGTADPKQLHECRAERWARSGVACTDVKLDERTVEVTCEVPARGGAPDFFTAAEKSYQHASYAALSAGRTHLVQVGQLPMQMRYQNTGTPVTCRETNRGARAVAIAFSGHATASTNCQTFGAMTTCNTVATPVPIVPEPQYQCDGGESYATPVGAVTRERYELLTDQEAAARSDPALPPSRQPIAARPIATAFSGMN